MRIPNKEKAFNFSKMEITLKVNLEKIVFIKEPCIKNKEDQNL
jgi:hypothetical protein